MLLPIFLPEMLLGTLTLWFGMTPLLSFIPVYILMLLILNASFCFDVKKKKEKKWPLLIVYLFAWYKIKR